MRLSVIGSARNWPDRADTNLTIGGLLDRHRGDIHRRRFGAIEHWFATHFTPVTFSTESRTSMPTPTLRRSSR